MSVQMNQYLGYGYLLPYEESMNLLVEKYTENGMIDLLDKYNDSAFDDKIVEINGFSFICDGMNGRYNFFGKIFIKGKNDMPCKTTKIPDATDDLKTHLVVEFINIFGDVMKTEPSSVLISHYR